MEEGEREDMQEESQANQSAGPVVIRAAATEEETESDDSGPPGLMDMDGNIVSSSSEDEEEVARRIAERENRDTPGLTDTSDGDGEDSDGTEDIARFVREEAGRRLGRLNFPALLNGRDGEVSAIADRLAYWRILADWP